MRAWYRNDVENFIQEDIDSILGKLSTGSVNDGFAVEQLQNDSWQYEISQFKHLLPASTPCHIFF